MARGLWLPFGKHEGKLIERVLVSHPDYIAWLDRQTWFARKYPRISEHVEWCIDVFDAKQFKEKLCWSRSCGKPATRFSLARGSPAPYFWCEQCDPRSSGVAGSLVIGRRYREALAFIEHRCDGPRGFFKIVVDSLAEAKGLSGKRTEKKLLALFHDHSSLQDQAAGQLLLAGFGS